MTTAGIVSKQQRLIWQVAMTGEFQVDPTSLTGAAATLHDLAHDLQAGQFDRFLLDWARDPASHPDVARAMRLFGDFAHDQYQDLVALLAALSTRVKAAAIGYQQTDEATEQDMTRFLTASTFRAADHRTK
ncbi:hypothetical protein [Planosporangium mesophilum]|uniref:Uncharacterized protein n=1 Tax=Planosporangium mesophilum TaxID=689768 RepID=A0A8J3X2U1_9ACTN|nr:hypothetical protein [Planosporangium mesophilum]NJC85763.1 hypothetical protein [Planosporangium mesophilum]GII24769.1 hypothetical protein Pme01_43660 [Planosporangium mesophilum]